MGFSASWKAAPCRHHPQISLSVVYKLAFVACVLSCVPQVTTECATKGTMYATQYPGSKSTNINPPCESLRCNA